MIGTFCCVIASENFLLFIGRAFIGLGIGTAIISSPLILSELTPSHIRGALITYAEISNNIGIFLGFVIGYYFSTGSAQNWRIMIGLGFVPPLLNIFLLKFFVPESPRWLIM